MLICCTLFIFIFLHLNVQSIVLYAMGLNGTGSSQAVSVKATYIYPQFRGYSKSRDYDNNIALLKLAKAFDICDPKVRLLDIAPVRLDDDYKSCLIFGWQSTVAPSSKVHAKPIQYSQVLLNSWRVCMYMHEGNASFKNVFCTMVEDANGIRACAGNPGSPVVCEDQYQRMVLLGIASWSNYSLDCGGLPTYLGVSIFRSWMWDLIFGNKNMDQWEIGAEVITGACQRERSIRGDDNLRLSRIRNYTDRGLNRKKFVLSDLEDPEETAYELSWKSFNKQHPFPSESKRIPSVTKIPDLHGNLQPPVLQQIVDYPKIFDHDDPRIVPNFDVVRVRADEMSQYREIGQIDPFRHDNTMDEPIAVPSQHKNIAYVNDQSVKIESNHDVIHGTENFDVLEFVMPDGLEDFNSSCSSTSVFYNRLFPILYTIYFSIIVYTFI